MQTLISAAREALGRTPSRILVLGPDRPDRSAGWGSIGATKVECRPALLEDDRDWDVIALVGALEAERWDRWLIQRVHRALSPKGVIVVQAPNLLDVFSLGGLSFLFGRIVREIRRRFRPRSAIPVADRAAFKGRRYRSAQLVAMCSGVHFSVCSCEPSGAWFPGEMGRSTCRHWNLIARREESLWGAPPALPFPVRELFLADFETRMADSIASRDRWAAEHGPSPTPQAFDLARFAGQPVAVFSPHPDDEVIGCGGALLALVRGGAPLTIVQVTDGSDSAAFIDEAEAVRVQVRLDEAAAVAMQLGARSLVCLRADNRALRATPELRARFRELLESTGARLVFAPTLTDLHPDHQTVIRILAEAMRDSRAPKPIVMLYEVWGLNTPTHILDVLPDMPTLEKQLLSYVTALKVDDYVHLVAERLLHNSYRYADRPGYTEAFRALEGSEFVELVLGHAVAR